MRKSTDIQAKSVIPGHQRGMEMRVKDNLVEPWTDNRPDAIFLILGTALKFGQARKCEESL